MMFKISKEDIEFITNNIPDGLNVIEEANKKDDLNILLLAIDAQITYQGFDGDYNLNDFGLIAQKMYDRIYYEN
ncbi:hypothetical protein [Thomasclavelia cocleata]|uniref:hypothetical protein n=1 Tax=Thomasclavelia cocleata TaxID=69824 RepID=UPI00242FC98E|nr:hypothetical protein [Thomasclavelia cocleata]